MPFTIIHIIEPFASGVATFVQSLTSIMPDDKHIIIHGERKNIISAADVKKNFPVNNVRYIPWRSARRSVNPFMDGLALIELYKILTKLKRQDLVNAVHLHSSKSGLLGRAACRMAGIENVFYTPNGAPFLSASNPVKKYCYSQLEKIGNRIGGKVICCSLSELEEYQKLGIDAEYINNGVTINDLTLRPLKLQQGKFRIVTSGRIETQKSPELFNSIASYFEDIPDVEFVWIGDGEDKKLFTAKNILVTGWLENNAVHQYVLGSDVYLSTSRYEGLSFAALEALALQKPVLLSNCTGNSDLVKKGLNGCLFSTKADAIVKILRYYNNREMLPVMGNFSKEICKAEFNVKQNFKAYRELYNGGTIKTSQPAWIFGY